jgi:hypothetical protein
MHRPKEVFRSKEQVSIRVVTTTEIFDGVVFPGGQERILDLLNGPDQFIPVEIVGRMRMVNKNMIMWVFPEDTQRMTDD